MTVDNCIFCKIIKGEIPSSTIYEDEDFKVILDIEPASKGHALVLPKKHYANIYEIDPDVLAGAVKVGQKVVKHAKEALGCEGYNFLQNNGEVAGQTVSHYHLHLIPRYNEPGNETILRWDHKSFTSEEMKEICESLKLD